MVDRTSPNVSATPPTSPASASHPVPFLLLHGITETASDPSLRVASNTAHLNSLSWETPLADWVKQAPEAERSQRQIVSEKIAVCIRNNNVKLDISGHQLTSLPPVFQHCSALKKLNCSSNRLTTLTLNNLPKLSGLDCNNNQLTTLTLTDLPALRVLSCSYNPLTTLTLHDLPALVLLRCNYTKLPTLTLQDLPALNDLRCNYNDLLTTLILHDLPALNRLHCDFNQLTTLTLYNLPRLRTLLCQYNPDLQEIPALRRGDVYPVPNDVDVELPWLRHLELAGTAVKLQDLSQGLLRHPDIYIDIQPGWGSVLRS